MKRFILAATVMLTTAIAARATEPFRTDVFFEGYNGYKSYRIPAAAVTTKGTVLAIIEARKNGPADAGDIDLMLRRSTDNGNTWGDPIMIYDYGTHTVGNPAPIVDRDTGDIILPFTIDNKTAHVTRSSDDGLTWSVPVDITSSVKKPGWEWYAFGPGHGIQLQDGRLLAPADHSEKRIMYAQAVYSDDHGATWHVGSSLPRETDESTALELADGSIYMNMRNNYFKGKRAWAISTDRGETWGKMSFDKTLVEPVCEGSTLRYSTEKSGGVNRVLFSNPADKFRINMTVRLSYDETATWPVAKLIDPGKSGYSDMVLLPDGQIGLFYENGVTQYWEKITFVRFSLAWLTDGKDK